MKKFIFTTSIIASMIIGCGGNSKFVGDEDDKDRINIINNNLKTIIGKVSDGPIGNAKVCIDKNLNGDCDIDEPFAITKDDDNHRGEYIIKYKENINPIVLIAEDYNNQAHDPQDNPDKNLSFYMISNNRFINPKTMQEYLGNYFSKIVSKIDNNVDINDSKDVFKKILTKKSKVKSLVKDFLGIKEAFQINKEIFEVAKQEIGSNTIVSSVKDTNISKVALVLTDETIPNVVPIGNEALVFTKKLQKAEVETSSNNENEIVLKRPIFSPITDISNKINFILKSSANYDKTVFITPYDSILEIPNYHELVNKGYIPLIGADVTVRDSRGNRIINKNKVEFSGVIEDDRKEDLGNNVNNLVYLYFDLSQNKWIKGADINTSGNNYVAKLENNLTLYPYVIAKKQNYKTVTINLNNVPFSNALVIAKGKAEIKNNYKILNKIYNDNIILDYQKINNELKFKVPKDFNITKLVFLDKNLKEIGESPVKSVDVKGNKVDLSNILGGKVLVGDKYEQVKGIIEHFINDYPDYEEFSNLYLDIESDDSNISEVKSNIFNYLKHCLNGKCTELNIENVASDEEKIIKSGNNIKIIEYFYDPHKNEKFSIITKYIVEPNKITVVRESKNENINLIYNKIGNSITISGYYSYVNNYSKEHWQINAYSEISSDYKYIVEPTKLSGMVNVNYILNDSNNYHLSFSGNIFYYNKRAQNSVLIYSYKTSNLDLEGLFIKNGNDVIITNIKGK